MPRVIISKPQLYFDHRTFTEGQPLDLDEQTAADFIRRGLVRRPTAPRLVYQTKIVTPESSQIVPEAPEVRPRLPFREGDGPVHNAEPPAVAAESDSVLPGADVPDKGTADSRRWRRREGFGSK